MKVSIVPRFWQDKLGAMAVACWLLMSSACHAADKAAKLEYHVEIDSGAGVAKVQIRVPDNDWLRSLDFNLNDFPIAQIQAVGETREDNGRLVWHPPPSNARIQYEVPLRQPRKQQQALKYSAYHTDDWLIMRSDDLVPPFKSKFRMGVEVDATLEFSIPESWQNVYTSYERRESHRFIVDSERTVPRPGGWLISGRKLSSRQERWPSTHLRIAGPANHSVRPMELLVLYGTLQPHFDALLGGVWPPKILIVSGNDPMWRGGLSADTSLFIHADRPLISEDGTSTLVHELFHVLVGIRAQKSHDWITEGLAEYYSVHLLRRANGYTAEREKTVFASLESRGQKAKTLFGPRASGSVTAKAAALFFQLNQEIARLSEGRLSLDDIVRKNIDNQAMSLETLSRDFQELTGETSKVLKRLQTQNE